MPQELKFEKLEQVIINRIKDIICKLGGKMIIKIESDYFIANITIFDIKYNIEAQNPALLIQELNEAIKKINNILGLNLIRTITDNFSGYLISNYIKTAEEHIITVNGRKYMGSPLNILTKIVYQDQRITLKEQTLITI